MAVALRLKRVGAHKNPHYRIVAADERFKRDGRFIEEIGHYNPGTEPATVKVDEEAALRWLADGAQPSETVKGLLRQQGILRKHHEAKVAAQKPAGA